MLQPAQLAQEAIDAALQCQWDTAREKNLQILEETPQDVCALNRLARACFELGDLPQAKELYQQVIEIDPYNAVAMKNHKRLSMLKDKAHTSRSSTSTLLSFIEEPGKTKIVQLVKTATPDILITLRAGDEVQMIQKSRGLHIFCHDDTYVGRLPDDTAFHILQLLQAGNVYMTFLKQIQHNKVFVFIKEHYRNESVMPYPSFPQFSSGSSFSYSPEQTEPVSAEV